MGLRPAVLEALPEHGSLGAFGKLMIEIEVLDFVAAQNRFDDAAVALRQHIAKSEELLVVG